ncbi:hypothetical protein G4177_26070 [Corallococcus sp. ZKHCc1 1396]|uniref:DUF4184 family protein n=1 Tax=Corallococcus soli TaxID=2710757 RepID=A0ABR9PUR2_9BACT|nr:MULTISPECIES: hypothetical protein [Corallococcus]MBE4751645.1 hypothetical protein [Corallococcus soli]MCY1035231.1 hypothetical protein [Corallococcus sp. BB11-1]
MPTLPASALDASEAPASVRFQGLWLFSPRADISLLLLPTLLMLACVWLASFTGEGSRGFSQMIGRWTSQYVFLNGTHVILTFLLVGTRRELLHTTPHQSRLLVGGSAAVFAVTFALFWYTSEHAPLLALLLGATVHILAAHHTLSQVKGLWALHGLRGRAQGAPPLSEAERTLQRQFVPLALVLMMARSLALPVTAARGEGPMINIGQAESGSLPHVLIWLLLAVWGVFVVRLVLAMRGPPGQSGPRRVYVLGHAAVVAVYLVWPLWGAILSAGIHGLEYFFLTGRMLEPTPAEPTARLRGPRVWLAMVAVMSPIILVGIVNSPFVTLVDGVTGNAATVFFLRQEPLWSLGVVATNAVVLAHYFADAFLYRFRIPRVREVTLPRLGLG